MKQLLRTISRSEWRLVIMLSLLMIILTGGPYLYGWLSAEPDTVYNGLHALSPGDIPVYYSYINQVKNGDFLADDLMTSEAQNIGTFNAWWGLLGIVARIFNLSVIFVFQLFRLLMIPAFIFIAYLFVSYFFDQAQKRKIALLFLLFSSGLGFYFAGLLDRVDLEGTMSYWWPIDLWLTEAITFNALYQTSHFIASIALMLLIFLLMLLAFDQKKISYVIWSGLLSLFYFNFHPYYFPVIFGVLGAYWLVLVFWQKKFLWTQFGYLAILFLIALPSALYHVWLLVKNPVIAQRALQNVTTISPVSFVLIGYGFLWLGFILGLYFLIKEKKFNQKFIFLVVWFLVNIFLIYSPFPFHSRYTQGLHIILVLFTVVGIFGLWDLLKARLSSKAFDFWLKNPVLLVFLFLIVFGMSNLYSLARDIYYFNSKPGDIKTTLYLPKDVILAFAWLDTRPAGQVVLASDIPAKFIPGFSGQTAYVAHAHETLFFYPKVFLVLAFFAGDGNDSAKIRFLTKQKIDYILYSEYEKQLGDFDPAEADYLELVFDRPGARIYRFIPEPLVQ